MGDQGSQGLLSQYPASGKAKTKPSTNRHVIYFVTSCYACCAATRFEGLSRSAVQCSRNRAKIIIIIIIGSGAAVILRPHTKSRVQRFKK